MQRKRGREGRTRRPSPDPAAFAIGDVSAIASVLASNGRLRNGIGTASLIESSAGAFGEDLPNSPTFDMGLLVVRGGFFCNFANAKASWNAMHERTTPPRAIWPVLVRLTHGVARRVRGRAVVVP